MPSIIYRKERLEKLKKEQEKMMQKRVEIIKKQEQEREILIRKEKERILQEKIDKLFKEFESLSSEDFESIYQTGKNKKNELFKSNSMGELSPELAKFLARAFKKGIKLAVEIIKFLPNLIEKINNDLTKEAIKNVNRRLKIEKNKLLLKEKKEALKKFEKENAQIEKFSKKMLENKNDNKNKNLPIKRNRGDIIRKK